jgi:hypothetical protein
VSDEARLNHVLDAIDNALVDDELGGDAMRWAPDVDDDELRGDPYGYYAADEWHDAAAAGLAAVRRTQDRELYVYQGSPIAQHHFRVDWASAYIEAPPRPSTAPLWVRGLRVVEDSAVPPGEVWIVHDTQFEGLIAGGAYYRRVPVSQTTEAHIPQGMSELGRESRVRQIAQHFGVPVCVIDGHQWGAESTGWTWNAELGAMVKECGRCDCDAVDVRPGRRLVVSGRWELG